MNKSLILKKNIFLILKDIKKQEIKRITQIKNNSCYSHNHSIINKLKKMEIIENLNILVLTEKGQEVYKNLKIIFNNTKMDYNKIYELREMKGGLK